ncbi:MAG: hypothetical protein IPM71_15565 [Bacteroidota bacterium]|nr:MAG: hypothetical protein IPM71_15565 [Bacteroidota bacterium]
MKYLLKKKYSLDLNFSEEDFRRKFKSKFSERNKDSIRGLKGVVEAKTFTINHPYNMLIPDYSGDRFIYSLFELIGSYNCHEGKTKVDLTVRLTVFTKFMMLLCLGITSTLIFVASGIYGFLICPLLVALLYLFLRVGLYISEPLYLDNFKLAFGLINEVLKDYSFEVKENIATIRISRKKRILYNILAISILSAVYLSMVLTSSDQEYILSTIIFIFIILTSHQNHLDYSIKLILKNSQVVDFWLFYKMALIPVPSLLFKIKKSQKNEIKKLRFKYNIITGLLYGCIVGMIFYFLF